jgi:hypothetical protein
MLWPVSPLEGELPTGEPCAGDRQARFGGGRDRDNRFFLPLFGGESMTPYPYVKRVIIKPESGQGDPGAYVLIGSTPDLRAVLEELLAAVNRFEARPDELRPFFHGVVVGDGSSRYEFTTLAVRADPDIRKHQRKTGWLWRFYDSNLAGIVALLVMVLAIIGAHTVWEWFVPRG